MNAIKSNPFMKDTKFFLQSGLKACASNHLIRHHHNFFKNRYYRYYLSDSSSLCYPGIHPLDKAKLWSGMYTLGALISLIVQLNYSNIIFVGVDLCDRRYSWLDSDATRLDTPSPYSVADPHPTLEKVITLLPLIEQNLQEYGVSMYTTSSYSALSEFLPILEGFG